MSRKYITFNYPNATSNSETLLTGIRSVRNSCKDVYISGFYKENGGIVTAFVYKGNLKGEGTFHNLNVPSSPGKVVIATSLYGPNNSFNDNIQVVGNYLVSGGSSGPIGTIYEGNIDGSGSWTDIIPPNSIYTIVHSTMGNLAVGNYTTNELFKGFIYDIRRKTYTDLILPVDNVITSTAYGIWSNDSDRKNGCGCYTIAGGFTVEGSTRGRSYIIDYCKTKGKFSNFTAYDYNNDSSTIETHFNGITGNGECGYNLTGDQISIEATPGLGFFAKVKREHKGFSKAKWSDVHFPGSLITSGNSVDEDTVIGVYTTGPPGTQVNGYVSIKK